MKRASFVIILGLFLLSTTQAHAAVRTTYGPQAYNPQASGSRVRFKNILITAFNWSDSDKQNASLSAALRVKANLESRGHHVTVCELPVVWDVAAQVAMHCFDQMTEKPNLVFSIGESGTKAGTLDLALAATNLDNGPEDDTGTARIYKTIDPRYPQEVSFRIPEVKLAPMIQAGTLTLRPHDAGAYICNNTAFHLVNEMQARLIPYFFVHIALLPQAGYVNGRLDETVGLLSGDQITQMLSLF